MLPAPMPPSYNGLESTRRRRPLRKVAVVSATIGVILNIITIIVNAKLHLRPPFFLNAWAFLPLVLSFIWSLLDLVLSRNNPQGKSIPPLAIVAVDTLGCLAFLTLLIANGITIQNLDDYMWRRRHTKIILLTYNSFPWIISFLVHMTMVTKTLVDGVGFRLNLQATCPQCKKTWQTSEQGKDAKGYKPLLQDHEEYNDEEEAANSPKQSVRLEESV